MIMSIETAIQKRCYVQIYGEHGRSLGSIPIERNDMLLGFTSESVTVKRGSFVNVYNEHGAVISSYPA